MSLRLMLLLLLTCLSFPLMARDLRQMEPDGGGPCADDNAQSDGASDARPVAAKSMARAQQSTKGKALVPHGGGDGINELRPPRWHSFLPGMFR
ncbi:MAG: hypothetical protein ACREO8_14270 [Luteimonas sp.]